MSKKHPNQQPIVKAWIPQEVSNLDIAFPTSVEHLMPAYRDIPEEFKDSWNPYAKLTAQWFFTGLSKSVLKAKSGIDAEKGFRHLSVIMGSWEPKHEHKAAGVAYLMSLWFDIV